MMCLLALQKHIHVREALQETTYEKKEKTKEREEILGTLMLRCLAFIAILVLLTYLS